MEKMEFWCEPSGEVFYRTGKGKVQRLTRFSKDLINELLPLIEQRFPRAYERLYMKHSSGVGPMECRFRMVNNFIRCNFGEHDLLTHDMVRDHLNLEEVRCPLRGGCGLCDDENVICRPRDYMRLSERQKETLNTFVETGDNEAVAERLGISRNTVKNTLRNICKKFGVSSVPALLAYIIQHNIVIE